MILNLNRVSAQLTTTVPIYTDSLQAGWQDWSWVTHNMAETSVVYSGSDAIEVNYTAWAGLWFVNSSMPGSQFSALSFYLNGGPSGGQRFSIHAETASGSYTPTLAITSYVPGGKVPANQWVHVTIPFTALGVSSAPDFNSILFQDTTGGNQPALYFDQLSLTGPTLPSSVTVSVNAAQGLRSVDPRVFGVNTESWDQYTDTTSVKQLLLAAGTTAIRCPGGSWSDSYNWATPASSGETMTPQYADLASSLGAEVYMTANYGSGTAQEAAAWVAYCNAAVGAANVNFGVDSNKINWQGSQYWASIRAASPLTKDDGLNFLRVKHTQPFAIHNWEFGNECYGPWETDNHASKQDPVTYANAFVAARNLMKEVDPTISVGAVITGDEDSDGNHTETVTNPVTGVKHSGWTAVLFSTLATLKAAPDSVSFHNYGDGGTNSSDPIVLHYPQFWNTYATNIRTMLTQYFGEEASANVELANTETNTTAGNPGKQTTSLVDGLYFADFAGSLLQTEFVANLWWDLHNGQQTGDNNDPSLYGWRKYGDYGILADASNLPGALVQDTPYPAYFALKLLSKFARGGDTVVQSSSSYVNLAAYAVHQSNGNLNVLVVNKEPTVSLPTTITLAGFVAASSAQVYQYGITQDNEQSDGHSVDLAQTTASTLGTSIGVTFPPYSMTVISLSPITYTASASPSSVVGKTTVLSVSRVPSGATYTWSTFGTPPAAVTYSSNGISASSSPTITFARVGTYVFQVTVSSSGVSTKSSPVTVTVSQTASGIAVTSAKTTVNVKTTQQLSAASYDQFGNFMSIQPTFKWSVASGGDGTVSSTGLFTAGSAAGAATVAATAGSLTGSVLLTVTKS